MKPYKLTFAGRKHTPESNKKRSETIKKMYANGVAKFGFQEKYTTDEQRKEARRISRMKSRYGITEEQFNDLFDQQNGFCAICHKPAVVVDHDHKTGSVRGLLCSRCNAGLGFFDDNIETLKIAMRYLEFSNEQQA